VLKAAEKPAHVDASAHQDIKPDKKDKFYDKTVLLFGAGAGGAQTYFSLPKSYNCIAFVDNDIAKQKTKLFGKPVIAPENISKFTYDSIIISSMFANSIEEQLLKIGIPHNKIEKGFS
jgi:FlaA1/EpsC-like NDP-sugar epimerase